jgi:DNA mismatch repair protein MutS2
VERAIAEIREKAAEPGAAFDAAARAARRSIEEAAAAQGAAVTAVEQRGARDRARSEQQRGAGASVSTATVRGTREQPLAEGDHVLVGTLGGKVGRILSLRGTEARVVVGSLTVTVPGRTLTRTEAAPAPAVKLPLGDFAEVAPVREVDVRGMRVDEVDDSVLQALDAAVRNDLRELRIIHGKGTGALRARVGEMLKKDTRVTGFRLGAWNEGGAGVTVAELA